MPTYRDNLTSAQTDKLEVDERIISYLADLNPWLVVLMKLGKKQKSKDVKITWLNRDTPALRDAINNAAGYTASDTTLTVDDASKFHVYDVVYVERTGEYMTVSAVDTTNNTITVTRGALGSTATDLNDNDPLFILGPTIAEGGTPQEYSILADEEYNYLELIIRAGQLTKTATLIQPRGERNFRNSQRDEVLREHKLAVERKLLLGRRYKSGNTRYTGGINFYIPSANVHSVSGISNLTLSEFNAFAKTAFAYGRNRKLLICGDGILARISDIAGGAIRVSPRETLYGIEVQEWRTPFGTWDIIYHPVLRSDYLGNVAFSVDTDNVMVKYTTLMELEPDISTTADAIIDMWRSEVGLEVKAPYTHAKLVVS